MISPLVAAALLLCAPPPALTPADLDDLHARLTSSSAEKWQSIPWKVDLLEARAIASREGTPLFLWSMNGHPLGCT
jgi:hypothetical protein